jgi:hypothetical protein
MTTNEPTTNIPVPSPDLELTLQEAIGRRQRATDLFGDPDWDEETAADEDEPFED